MIGEDFGRLFEVGFNVGILAYIQRENIAHNFGDSYRLDLHKLSLPKMMAEIIREANLLGSLDAKIVEKWSLFFVQKGFLGGLNFFREYVKSTGWNLKLSQILYCQCSFSDANSIRTYNKDEKVAFKEVLSQFKIAKPNLSDDEINSYIRRYKKKGEFLQADTLILLQNGQDLRILCVDLSVFTPPLTSEKVDDLNEIEVMRKSLLREISYLRSKSVFSNLRIDTSTLGIDFSEGLNRYFTAFKYKDKESAKLIQAGSYAHSFYGFLQATGMIPGDAEVLLNVVGYSDRTINAISLRHDQIELLANCAKIYQQEPPNKEINAARGEVLDATQLNAARSFQNGKKFVKDLLTIGKTATPVCNTERVDNFVNSIDIISDQLADDLQIDRGLHLRNAHAQLIFKALESEETYLFLTGNPGIGKTTAIANFLKTHIDDGFLFFYVSPRKQVNLDIIEKFRDQKTGLLCDNRLFCINTNSDIIHSNYGKCTVNYAANNYHENFPIKTVQFIKDNAIFQQKSHHQPQLKKKGETVIQPTISKTQGVLNSVCEAIYSLIDRKTSNNIVATVSIQSLKVTQTGKNTLQHLEKIFQDAYNKRDKRVIPAKMQEISSRIKHIFIMIDEITGDDGGVEFLHGIGRLLNNYELHNPKHGFNTKIIVADASIVDPDVIKQHLNDTSPEPDKIYFKKLPKNSEEIPPLQAIPFEFKRLAAKVINTNSYPASSLDITYKVFVEAVKFTEDISLNPKNDLVKRVQSQIIEDINQRLAIPGVEQIIVYIQDKRRLTELIMRIRSSRERFEQFLDYLEVHANISEEEKEQIQKCKNKVKVIFMTASGSRGLSFPKTKHILVDIPRFQIEKNLMEVIQVIYRGRGEDEDGNTLDGEAKELVFYLSDTAVYYADDAELSLQESKLSLLNLLLILKTAVMTRIVGYGYLGREKFLMIPIGGKSVSAVGDTFSSKIASLIKALKSEYRSRPQNVYFKDVYEGLEELLSRGEYEVSPKSEEDREKGNSYLEMRENFNRKFLQMCNPLEGLLGYDHLEIGHVLGSLLLVPLADKSLKENYQMRLNGEIKKCLENQLLKKMETIGDSKSSPENVKSAIRGGAIELLHILNDEVEKTQYLEQQSQQFDRYYAIPLFAFVSGEEMQEYFAQTKLEEPEDRKFRDILSAYVRSIYPVDSVMPIGHKYHDFPFIVFRSYSLEQSREKIFTDKYLLSSNELNVLNLILSKQIN